jgi:hypothetical protein
MRTRPHRPLNHRHFTTIRCASRQLSRRNQPEPERPRRIAISDVIRSPGTLHPARSSPQASTPPRYASLIACRQFPADPPGVSTYPRMQAYTLPITLKPGANSRRGVNCRRVAAGRCNTFTPGRTGVSNQMARGCLNNEAEKRHTIFRGSKFSAPAIVHSRSDAPAARARIGPQAACP